MGKIIATDLDGTLFYPRDRKNVICKANLFFIQSFIDNGGKVVICSGRSLLFGQKVKKIIDRDIDIISFNGGCVFCDNKIIDAHVIPNEEASKIIDDIHQDFKFIGLALMCEDGMYIKIRKHKFVFNIATKLYFSFLKNLAEELHEGEEEYEDALKNKKIFKILILFGLTKKANKRAEETSIILNNTYSDIVECAFTDMCIEITATGIKKGTALKAYQEYKNVSEKDIYVVGDSGNDISMFKEFYENSFVMDHSAPSIKRYAKYVIDKFSDLSRYISQK